MVYFTPSTSLAAWKVKQTMEKKKKILKLCSQALEGKAATQHLEQRLLERFLDGGKKTNLTASRKRIPSSLYRIQLLWLYMSAQEHKCLLSSFFHIWKIYRDCKYLEVLWQWMLPFLITQCSLLLTFRFFIFIHVFLASAHFVFWKHAYKTYMAYYWKYKVTFRSIISCLSSGNNFAMMCLSRMVLLNSLHMQDLQGRFQYSPSKAKVGQQCSGTCTLVQWAGCTILHFPVHRFFKLFSSSVTNTFQC